MENFQLEEFAKRGNKLLEDTRRIFNNYQDLGLKFMPLPETMQPKDGAVKLVFVGQYSAGKSSIIKMLSGIDTKIGAGITTQESHTYQWNGLEIIDTPGIHTELRPDHDEKSYYEINHAALLIFVVTNEGFDDRMGHHFRKLAIEQNRGKNMVLVVNKMDRTALGNVPEQQEIIAQDLQKVITPLTSQDLFLSFLNTEYYFEWQTETDEELKEIYLQQSGYEKFVENLNKFVASRGVLSKIQSPLETLKIAITNVIGKSENLSVDKDIDAAEELLRRRKKTLTDGSRRIKSEIAELTDNLCSKIKMEGSNAAATIQPGITQEQAENNIKKAQNKVDDYIKSYERKILNCIAEIGEEIQEEISLINSSNFALNVQINIADKIKVQSDGDKISEIFSNTKSLKKFNATSTDAAKETIFGMKAAEIVKDVGHFFGIKFAPWGAVNFVKGMGYIGVAITAYQILSKLFGEDKEKEMLESLRKAREDIQNNFNKVAEDSRNALLNSATSNIEKLTAPVIQDAENKISEFHTQKDRLKSLGYELQKVLADVETLMDEVQKTAGA